MAIRPRPEVPPEPRAPFPGRAPRRYPCGHTNVSAPRPPPRSMIRRRVLLPLALLLLASCDSIFGSDPLEGTFHLTTINGVGAPLVRGDEIMGAVHYTNVVQYDTLEFRSDSVMYRSTSSVQTAVYPDLPAPLTGTEVIQTLGRYIRRGDRLIVTWDIPANRMGAPDTIRVRGGKLVRRDWFADKCPPTCGLTLRDVDYVYQR